MSEHLTGDALRERAIELDIEGRSAMTADELRAAIEDAEAAADRDVPDDAGEDVDAVRVAPGMESGAASTSHRVTTPLT